MTEDGLRRHLPWAATCDDLVKGKRSGQSSAAIARALIAERSYVWVWKQLASGIVASLLLVSRGEVFKAWGKGQQIALHQTLRRAQPRTSSAPCSGRRLKVHVARDVAKVQVIRQG